MTKMNKFLMLACCLVGLGAAVAVLFFNVPFNKVFLGVMILFCPLSHLLMMKFMGHDHGQQANNDHCNPQQKSLNENASEG